MDEMNNFSSCMYTFVHKIFPSSINTHLHSDTDNPYTKKNL